MPDDVASHLTKWPDAARDVPDTHAQPGRPLDGWLYAAGVVYPIVSFIAMIVGIRSTSLSFGPEVILTMSGAAIFAAVCLKLIGESVRWSTVFMFAIWIVAVTCNHLRLWGGAVASC